MKETLTATQQLTHLVDAMRDDIASLLAANPGVKIVKGVRADYLDTWIGC